MYINYSNHDVVGVVSSGFQPAALESSKTSL